jgi:thioredoxin reductase
MEEQFWEHDFKVIKSRVGKVGFTGNHFTIDSAPGTEFDGVILCTGTRPIKAGFPGEDELAAAGLLHYGISRLPEIEKGSNVLVVGGGEASMDISLTMAEKSLQVTLLHRSKPRGIKNLLDSISAEERISMLEGTVENARQHSDRAVARIGGEERPFGLIIVAVGRESQMPELEGIDIEFPPAGFRIAGDAKHGGLGQTAMAAGDGVRAAMEAGREARK